MKIFLPGFLGFCPIIYLVSMGFLNKKGFMKKIAIVAFVLLSVQLFSQTQSLAYRIPYTAEKSVDSLLPTQKNIIGPKTLRVIGQGLTGTGIGIVMAVIGGSVGHSLAGKKSQSGEEYLGAFLGYTVGNALGIYWIGNTKELHGSFGVTLLGSTIGVVVGGLGVGVVGPFALLLPGVGGIIAFYLSAEEVIPNNSEALIQIQNEKVQLGNPKIFLTRIDETSNKLRYNFELLRVNF